MIKSFKIFESNNKSPFKDGEFVICIKGNNDSLVEGNKYEIKNTFRGDLWFCFLKEIPGTFFSCSRFVTELEYYANKYNL